MEAEYTKDDIIWLSFCLGARIALHDKGIENSHEDIQRWIGLVRDLANGEYTMTDPERTGVLPLDMQKRMDLISIDTDRKIAGLVRESFIRTIDRSLEDTEEA